MEPLEAYISLKKMNGRTKKSKTTIMDDGQILVLHCFSLTLHILRCGFANFYGGFFRHCPLGTLSKAGAAFGFFEAAFLRAIEVS